MKPRMDAKERELILKEEVYPVAECAIDMMKMRDMRYTKRLRELFMRGVFDCTGSNMRNRNGSGSF
jgi:hypothetical protein